jgi:hypothetical protein
MSVFGLVGCMVNRHDPDRKAVKWNGHDFVGECRHCGVPIERKARRHWKKSIAGDEVAG